MRKRSFVALLLSVCLLASCTAAPNTGSGKKDKKTVDYDELRAKEGTMFYMGTYSCCIQYEGENDWTSYSFVVEWNGHVTRRVCYQVTDTLYYEADLNDKDYEKLYEFSERCLKKDPFRNYSEEVCDGQKWWFDYYYSEDEEPFEIYDGYCYNEDELNEIIDMMRSYFPQIEYIPYPVEEIVTVDEFKEWYGLADGEIDDEYIEDFIYFWQVKPSDMQSNDYKSVLADLIANENFEQLGYSMDYNKMCSREITDENIYTLYNTLDDASWIYMTLDIPVPDTADIDEVTMLVDFRKNKVYFDVDPNNYLNSGKCVELTDDVREMLIYDLSTHVGTEDYKDTSLRDCYYEIYIYNSQFGTMDYGYIDINNFSYYRLDKEFDEYWQTIYEMSFGEAYVPSVKEAE